MRDEEDDPNKPEDAKEVEPEVVPMPETEPVPEPQPEAETESEPQPEAETVSEPQPELEAVSESKTELDPESELQRQPEPRPELEKPKLCCSARLMLSFVCFLALFSVSYNRVGISMAFVCMASSPNQNDEFKWSSTTKGYLISAVFYGFIVGPFVAGILSFKFGGKVIMVIGIIGSGATNFFVPEATRASPILFFAIRVVTGFFCSFTFPAFYDLVSRWIVPDERQLLVAGAMVGIPLASIINFPASTFICEWCGWVWLFYIVAIWMVLWGIVFYFLIFDYPELCPFISEKELQYLKHHIPHTGELKIPWKKIIKSVPIYAYIVMHFCVNYVYLTIVLSLPLLLETVHHFSFQANGLLSATPFMGSFLMRVLLSLFFEQLRLKLKLSKNTLRKIFVFVGAILVSLFLFIVTLLSCAYRYWVLGCFIMASSSLELCLTGGYLLSLLDLCPSYVNIITGIANTVGNTAGLISPVVNGFITPHGTREEWNSVFYVNISVLLAATTFYLVFGSNHLLYWGLATLPTQTPIPRATLVN